MPIVGSRSHCAAQTRLVISLTSPALSLSFSSHSLSTPRPVIHDCHRVYIGYKKFTESRGRSHIVRPSASLAPLLSLPESPSLSSQPPRGHPTTILHSFSLYFSLRLETGRWGGQEVYRPYLYPCMVPIKREPLTAFVSDTVAMPVEEEGEGGR